MSLHFDLYVSIKPECIEGLHGVNCSRNCSGHCIASKTCNHVTGQCDEGCDAGWTGFLCDKS